MPARKFDFEKPIPIDPTELQRIGGDTRPVRQIIADYFVETGDKTIVSTAPIGKIPIAHIHEAEELAERTLKEAICPHRGAGAENTVRAVGQALLGKPRFVEFDVQLWEGKLHLGHPPDVNEDETIEDVLQLFRGSDSWPKIDLKLDAARDKEALQTLLGVLKRRRGPSIVNIGGKGTPHSYMAAEQWLTAKTSSQCRLNVDLERYGNLPTEVIDRYIVGLPRPPFSVSPNLEKDFTPDVAFAGRHRIKHIHFWAYEGKEYAASLLRALKQELLKDGFAVYFDISHSNIDYSR